MYYTYVCYLFHSIRTYFFGELAPNMRELWVDSGVVYRGWSHVTGRDVSGLFDSPHPNICKHAGIAQHIQWGLPRGLGMVVLLLVCGGEAQMAF